MIDLVLLLIFLVSGSVFSILLAKKAPVLRTIPEETVRHSFRMRPSHVHRFGEFFSNYLRISRYESACILFLEKALRRTRVWVLKIDSLISRMLLRIQERSKIMGEAQTSGYWQDLNDWRRKADGRSIPDVTAPPERTHPKVYRVKKIFVKKNDIESDIA